MLQTLQALKHLVSPEPPPPAHVKLEHLHWDRETRTWTPHIEIEEGDSAA